MRICFITFGNVKDYATLKRATGMAEPLIARGHEVFIVIEDSPDNRERLEFECPNAKVLFCQRLDRKHDQREREALARSVDPDVVWICGLGVRNWVRFRTGRKRPVFLMDHVELFSGIQRMSRWRQLWDAFIEWRSLFAFDGHLCASRYLESLFSGRIARFGGTARTFYFPYAYGDGLLKAEPEKVATLRERYPGKVILYMGSFYENYGCLDMLKAVQQLVEHREDFYFVMMGGGPLKERCRGWTQEPAMKGRAEVLGYIPEEDLAHWFAAVDAFVCPLRDTIQDWARCPSKLYMYLPFKKPILTSAVGEAVTLLHEDAFFYTPGDVKNLAEAMEAAMDAGDWRPTVNPEKHNWNTRADQWLVWMKKTYPWIAS
jgi:glycosyltransferase involved in cell wall biosynthesis